VALPTRMPSEAPCEGLAGLSRTDGDPTPVAVHLAPSISAVIREMKKVSAVTEIVDTTEGNLTKTFPRSPRVRPDARQIIRTVLATHRHDLVSTSAKHLVSASAKRNFRLRLASATGR